MKFIKQFEAARRVSTPLVAIRTNDARSTVTLISEMLASQGAFEDTPLVLWDCLRGTVALNKRGQEAITTINCDAPQVLPALLDSLSRYEKDDLILFLSNMQLQFASEDATAVIQGVWNLRDLFKQRGNMLVLLTSPGAIMPNELLNDVFVLDEPLPTREQLEKIVSTSYKDAGHETNEDVKNLAVDSLIGLSAFSAEQSSAMCLDVDGAMDTNELWEKKRTIVSQTRGLSMVKSDKTLADVGGLENIKQFLKQIFTGKRKPKICLFTDEIEKAFAGTGTDMSGTTTKNTGEQLSWMQKHNMLGILAIGLPGTSKTAIVEAMTNEFEVPMINFNFAAMESGIVGSSGENLRAAHKTVEAIAGDGQILFIATCNSINALPPELRRRFKTATFFFDAPTELERKAIWDIYRERFSIPASQVTPNDKGWTGAEIAECAEKADMLGITLQEAASYIVPLTESASDVITALRMNSSGKYLSASHAGRYVYDAQESFVASQTPVLASNPTGRKVRG